MHEVHTPALRRADGLRRRPAMQRDVFPPAHAHPHLQTVETIQPPHALRIHPPAFPSEEDPNAQIAEARALVRNRSDAAPQGFLIGAPTPAIPRRPTELRQVAGPPAADTEGRVDPAGQLAALCGPQTFFRRASVRMCLSSERSATS